MAFSLKYQFSPNNGCDCDICENLRKVWIEIGAQKKGSLLTTLDDEYKRCVSNKEPVRAATLRGKYEGVIEEVARDLKARKKQEDEKMLNSIDVNGETITFTYQNIDAMGNLVGNPLMATETITVPNGNTGYLNVWINGGFVNSNLPLSNAIPVKAEAGQKFSMEDAAKLVQSMQTFGTIPTPDPELMELLSKAKDKREIPAAIIQEAVITEERPRRKFRGM